MRSTSTAADIHLHIIEGDGAELTYACCDVIGRRDGCDGGAAREGLHSGAGARVLEISPEKLMKHVFE